MPTPLQAVRRVRVDPPCLDLKAIFGKRYRVRYEESYAAQYGPRAYTPDPWLMILPCRYGHICPWGGSTLAASVDGHTGIARKLARLGCCHVHQDGDCGELTATFDVADFAKVAAIMRPRRRRQITDAERRRLRELSAKFGYHPAANDDSTRANCVPTPPDDPGAVQTAGRENLPTQQAIPASAGHATPDAPIH